MAYPVRDVSRPAALNGQANGRLDPAILWSTPGLAGGVEVRLVEPAARAWRALTAAALAAGHTLKATSRADSYRLYEIQERIFRERYTTQYLAGRPTKKWNGQTWYQRPGTAVAAVPGTSNHGWALAVDTGEERDSDLEAESLDSETLNWLLANEERFGFSHEVQSEPWHIRYFAGDQIPDAVIAHEGGAPPPPPPRPAPTQEYVMDTLDLRNADRSLVTGRHVDNMQALLIATWSVIPAIHPHLGKMVNGYGLPDGKAGAGTKAALKVFQKHVGLDDDAICGKNTWKALIEF